MKRTNYRRATFGMEIVPNQRLAPGHPKKFELVAREPDDPLEDEPVLAEFLQDPALSANATRDEVEFMKRLRFNGKQPGPLYYYRVLQSPAN